MLDAFKIKPFDLEPIFAQWKEGPFFNGNTKKDLPVEEWLEKIKEGCVQRGVPEEYWYKVAQHFMGPTARARLDELKKVIVKVHGGKYRWTWKKFKIAVMNMGWTIDKDAKETIKVQAKGSGLWFMRKKETELTPVEPEENSTKSEPLSSKFWTSKKIVEEPVQESSNNPPRTRISRSATVSSFWSGRINAKEDKELPPRPPPHKAKSQALITPDKDSSSHSHASSEVDEVITTTTQVPAWLLNACTALEYITNEHPKAMSIISAILITAGSIPAIPAIAAGAGGAVLASTTAHAIGVLAVGVGQALAGINQTPKKPEGQGSNSGH